MLGQSFFRLPTFLFAALCLLGIIGLPQSSTRPKLSEDDLVVHEWGTFTSVVGQEGYPRRWRPLSFESDLPSFVYSIDRGASWRGSGLRYNTKSRSAVTVRMETPVIYFYAKEEKSVSVKVGFPGGEITEWYPRARVGESIEWGPFQVLPGATVYFPIDGRENHYYPARATDAAPIRVTNDAQIEHEKFLFYRGVGDFSLPVSPKIQGDKIAISVGRLAGAAKVFVFEKRAGRVGYLVQDLDKEQMILPRPELGERIGELNRLQAEMKALLVANGLFVREADAMLETWRDAWFEEGLRIFYVLPRETTDTILPITITPQPASLVRVLVGRTELITPEMEKDVTQHLGKLDHPSFRVRDAALKEINKYHRFAAPILEQVLEHTKDLKLKARVQKLLVEMEHVSAA